MHVYLLQRLVTAFLTLFGMSAVIFVLLRLAPGNIVDILFATAGFVNPAAKQEIARELGLDQPIPVQYGRWLKDIARGKLGKSYRYDIPAWQVIRPRIPVSVELAILALLIAVFAWGTRRCAERHPAGYGHGLPVTHPKPCGTVHAFILARHGDHHVPSFSFRMDSLDDLRLAVRRF